MSLVKHVCQRCNDSFASKYSLKRHLEKVQCRVNNVINSIDKSFQIIDFKDQQVVCHICNEKVPSRVKLIKHLNLQHLFNASIETDSFASKEEFLE